MKKSQLEDLKRKIRQDFPNAVFELEHGGKHDCLWIGLPDGRRAPLRVGRTAVSGDWKTLKHALTHVRRELS